MRRSTAPSIWNASPAKGAYGPQSRVPCVEYRVSGTVPFVFQSSSLPSHVTPKITKMKSQPSRKPAQSIADVFSFKISPKPLLRDSAVQTGMSLRYRPRRLLNASTSHQLLALTTSQNVFNPESALGLNSRHPSHSSPPPTSGISTFLVEMSKVDGNGMSTNVKISASHPPVMNVSTAHTMPSTLRDFLATALPFLQIFKEAPPRPSAPH